MRAALTVALALLGGCVSVPKVAPPAVPLPATALGLRGAVASPAPPAWWRSLGDPQLDALIGRALSASPGLAETAARLREAQAQADQAHASQLPEARLSGGETRTKVPAGFGPYLLGGDSVWFGDLGARLSWNADLWGRAADQAAAARDRVRVAGLQLAAARLVLTGAIVQAYLDLDRAYAMADVARAEEAQRARVLAITRTRVAAGLDTRVELREAEGALPQAHLALLQAQAAQELARHQLAALAGGGADAYAGIGRPRLQPAAVLPLPAALPINLLARRPDVIAARTRIQVADAQRRAARAAFYPSISLAAFVGFASISLSDLVSAQAFGYGAGPALSLPLFDAGRLRAQYRGAAAGIDAAVAAYDETVLAAVRESADQLTLIDALGAQLQQQRQWLAAADEAYRLAQERYQAGLANYLSVLTAETAVLAARRTSVDLTSAQAAARVRLLIALGGGFRP